MATSDSLATTQALNSPLEGVNAPLASLEGELKLPKRSNSNETSLGIVPRNIEEAVTIAKAFAMSGMFPDAKNAGQALAKILAGAEYGIGPATSMQAFHYVQGKMQASGVFIGSLIKRHPRYDYRVIESTQDACELAFFEHGEEIGRERFTMKDAQRQKTQNTEKYPKNMLWNRAMSNGAKFYTPDIFMGGMIYVEGEIYEQPAQSVPEETKGNSRVKALLEARKPKPEPSIEGEFTDMTDDTPFVPDGETLGL